MNDARLPPGAPGLPWGDAEKADWRSRQRRRRSYVDEVVEPLCARLPARAELFEHAVLDHDAIGCGRYPLLAVRNRDWRADRPTLLVTGGVHGYETSGVQGALQWIADDLEGLDPALNVLVLPCVSPWGYETVNRWNPLAVDPNRQFKPGSLGAAESALAMACVAAHGGRVEVHVDLHETTDTDNSEFGPAKAARDGVAFVPHDIPDGFYLVADSGRPEAGFQRALIDAVRRVAAIADPDAQGRIIGLALQQPGVVEMDKRAAGLCAGMTAARFVTTTEVYPDGAKTTPAQCDAAQVAAVRAAVAYVTAGAATGAPATSG